MLWHFGLRFVYWELMSTPRLDPRRRMLALAAASTVAVAGFFGWQLPRLVRWIATGEGAFRPSRHTAWPTGSTRAPSALVADLETLGREGENGPGRRPAG